MSQTIILLLHLLAYIYSRLAKVMENSKEIAFSVVMVLPHPFREMVTSRETTRRFNGRSTFLSLDLGSHFRKFYVRIDNELFIGRYRTKYSLKARG